MNKQQQVVTVRMVNQYAHLTMVLAQEIFDQLDTDSLKKAQVVIGLPVEGLSIAWAVNRKINNYRKRNGVNLECRVIPTALIERFALLIPFKKVRTLLWNVKIKERHFFEPRKAIFVGYKVDNPILHPNNAPWKRTLEAKRHFELLHVVDEDKKRLKSWLTIYGYNLLQSVILPVPREEYVKFITDIENSMSDTEKRVSQQGISALCRN